MKQQSNTELMKTKFLFLAGALAFTLMSFISKDVDFNIGDKAPMTSYEMKATDGKMYSLDKLSRENGLLVIFSCNTCPFVVGNHKNEGWQGRYNELQKLCNKNDIGMVLVNSNEGKRADEDSYEAMVAHAKAEKYKSPYVVDSNSQLANAFSANTTPHVYLLDNDLKLRYTGAIDDNVKDSKAVQAYYLKDAISNLSKGKKINPAETQNIGCSIKR